MVEHVETVVRRAGRDDSATVARLRHAWASEQVGRPLDDPSFDEVFEAWFDREHDQRVALLAEVEDRAVGMLNMLLFTRMPKPERPVSRWGYVANVYVDQAHRDRGVGAMLLADCIAYAREHDFARLVLSPSERSMAFYERAGFGPATNLMVHNLS